LNNIAVFGGSFNPVHNGHIYITKCAAEHIKIDKLFVIPTFHPPHKASEELVSGEHRYNMLELAFEKIPFAEVNSMELNRTGISYTQDTLNALKMIYTNSIFYLIIGGDMLLNFKLWKNYKEIIKTAKIICMAREAGQKTALQKTARELGNVLVLDTPEFPLSSAGIREKIKTGENVKKYLPEKVYDYIKTHKLYIN